MSSVQFPMLKSMFPDYIINGAIFSKMPNAPWAVDNFGLEMDIVYLGSHSGIKPPAMLPFDFVTDGVLDQQKLADTLWKLFGHNWQKLWDAYMSEYDPLQNYKITDKTVREENIERDIQRNTNSEQTVEDSSEYTENSSVDYTDDATSETTNNLSTKVNETDNTVVSYGQKIDTDQTTSTHTYGFNDATRVPTGVAETQSHETHSGTDNTNLTIESTTANTGTVNVANHDKADTTNSVKSDTTNSTKSNIETGVKTDDDVKDNETIDRDRSGNIGQNTFQELLRQEFELWKWNFYLQVFADCDRFLVLPYFGSFCSQIMSRLNTVN